MEKGKGISGRGQESKEVETPVCGALCGAFERSRRDLSDADEAWQVGAGRTQGLLSGLITTKE